MVAIEQAVSAPLATRHLADLGADVVKVERLGEGDFARAYDDHVNGLASHFVWLNRGKRSIAVDLKSTAGQELADELISGSDVFVQNLAPGSAERLGLDAETLNRKYPQLITINLSGYGTEGPYAPRKAYDLLVQAESGLISITGTPEYPSKTGVPSADIAAGLYAVTAALGALFRRERTGVGAVVDVSMFDATAEWLGHPMYVEMYAGIQTPRMGLAHSAIAPYDAYPTANGQVLIGVQNDRGWQQLARHVFEDEELAQDPRFATNISRVRFRTELDEAVSARTRGWESAELGKRLAEAGVPAAELNDIAGLIQHPQLTTRDRWRDIETENGSVRALLPPMTFRDTELPMGDVPALGQHTDAVLADLGRSAADIAELRHDLVVA